MIKPLSREFKSGLVNKLKILEQVSHMVVLFMWAGHPNSDLATSVFVFVPMPLIIYEAHLNLCG